MKNIFILLFVGFIVLINVEGDIIDRDVDNSKFNYKSYIRKELERVREIERNRRIFEYKNSEEILFKKDFNSTLIEDVGALVFYMETRFSFDVITWKAMGHFDVLQFRKNDILSLIIKDIMTYWDHFYLNQCDGVVFEDENHVKILTVLRLLNKMDLSLYHGKVMVVNVNHYFDNL
jgi:hypothetical protein